MTGFREYEPGLYSAGQPTIEQLRSLARDGVRTIINLRSAHEPVPFDEPRAAAEIGLRYVSIPVVDAEALLAATIVFARALDEARRHGDTLVHCASGNRVGAVVALDRGLIRRATSDEALAVGRRAGLAGLEPAVAKLLGQNATSQPVSDDAASPTLRAQSNRRWNE